MRIILILGYLVQLILNSLLGFFGRTVLYDRVESNGHRARSALRNVDNIISVLA